MAATGAAMTAAAKARAMSAAVSNGGGSRRPWAASATVSTQPRDSVTGRDLTTFDSGFAVIASDDVGTLAALWKRLGKDAEVLLTRR